MIFWSLLLVWCFAMFVESVVLMFATFVVSIVLIVIVSVVFVALICLVSVVLILNCICTLSVWSGTIKTNGLTVGTTRM